MSERPYEDDNELSPESSGDLMNKVRLWIVPASALVMGAVFCYSVLSGLKHGKRVQAEMLNAYRASLFPPPNLVTEVNPDAEGNPGEVNGSTPIRRARTKPKPEAEAGTGA